MGVDGVPSDLAATIAQIAVDTSAVKPELKLIRDDSSAVKTMQETFGTKLDSIADRCTSLENTFDSMQTTVQTLQATITAIQGHNKEANMRITALERSPCPSPSSVGSSAATTATNAEFLASLRTEFDAHMGQWNQMHATAATEEGLRAKRARSAPPGRREPLEDVGDPRVCSINNFPYKMRKPLLLEEASKILRAKLTPEQMDTVVADCKGVANKVEVRFTTREECSAFIESFRNSPVSLPDLRGKPVPLRCVADRPLRIKRTGFILSLLYSMVQTKFPAGKELSTFLAAGILQIAWGRALVDIFRVKVSEDCREHVISIQPDIAGHDILTHPVLQQIVADANTHLMADGTAT